MPEWNREDLQFQGFPHVLFSILLENRCYDVLEINIDHPGGSSPSLPELMPALKRIQAARMPLLLWGELTPDAWRCLRQKLSPIGLSLQPIVRRENEMPALLEALAERRT